ncbi:hypothetical protein [Bacillus sp. FJAT-47783]|uniref:hypothetical protein n=1 Tax=Bacillus sp. FJAT-47783 TaxID=2922712 RepID=UPI001FACEE5A|nr:hypothetical protein [Bacillus sp. FJAT-47783]
MKIFKTAFTVILSTILLFGCSITDEEVKEEATEAIHEAFQQSPVKANESVEQFSFYLPESFEIESHSGNNLILKEGSQQYLLFLNPNEKRTSEMLYKKAKETVTDLIIDKTSVTDEAFTYTIVSKIDENTYEVIAGLGGAKLTTHVEGNEVAKSAKKLVEIVRSVQY